jgi:hypothetical protein
VRNLYRRHAETFNILAIIVIYSHITTMGAFVFTTLDRGPGVVRVILLGATVVATVSLTVLACRGVNALCKEAGWTS